MIGLERTLLLTDLYQLTMLDSYLEHGVTDIAAFEFFVRRLPDQRNFLLAAGLEQALAFLDGAHFDERELEWLAGTGKFDDRFITQLAAWRFSGDVYAADEGTVFFADEPVLRVVAPIHEAQLVESRLVNILHYQTLVATKAARCVLAAPEKTLVDFGMRRAHGAEAALLAARAAFLAGFAGTATVLAERRFGIPTVGTMAHSFIEAHDDEVEAFEHFAVSHPANTVLLIDTYDTLRGAERVADLAARLAARKINIRGVRIDSGDLAAQSFAVREILDARGLTDAMIFLSGSLDEYQLEEFLAAGVPADGFGIGTHLDVSQDAPSLDCVYKLQEYAGRARRKRSRGKATWPGRKQVFRRFDDDGKMAGDVLGLAGEDIEGQPMLRQVMRDGKRLDPPVDLQIIRSHARQQLCALPGDLASLGPSETGYPVEVSRGLEELAAEVDRQFK